ncbi:MAG: hypothetical protein IJ697_07640 [Synergistaceae bacterium]|nr:hypothetical protein [Synergistaceae bacterium]
MSKICLKLSLTAFMLSFVWGVCTLAEAAQTINGKAIGNVDDIVKEVNKGELALPKKGLITLRGGDFRDNSYVDVFASLFGRDASASSARKIFTTYPTSDPAVGKMKEVARWKRASGYGDGDRWLERETVSFHVYEGEPKFFRPAVSRRLYNGKRALMFHNIAPNGSLKYYFKTLSNTRGENTIGATPDNLANTLSISDFGTYTSPAFSNAVTAATPDAVTENCISEVYGTGVMSVRGYDREIFVAASGLTRVEDHSRYDISPYFSGMVTYHQYMSAVYPKSDQDVRLEFFAISADNDGNMTYEALTGLTRTTPFRQKPHIVSIAVGDFDGDKYNNEVALMINSREDIRLFVYRLSFSGGKLEVMSLCKPEGIHVFSTNQWGSQFESQPVTDMVAGDFDGDGTSEIALFFKETNRAENLKNKYCWPDGPKVGKIHCKIFKWNAKKGNTGDFDTAETVKEYTDGRIEGVWYFRGDATILTGVIAGLRAAAADLDGDGRDEIVTLLLGYSHFRDVSNGFFKSRTDDVRAYPHLAVWKFNENNITPIHDDAHVKGGMNGGREQYRDKFKFGPLYDLVKNQTTNLLGNDPLLAYAHQENEGKTQLHEGTNPSDIWYMYAPRMLSIAAGPFTGTFGAFRTVDDIAVAWKDKDGSDCVTIFKTKLNASKQFDGFEDGKLAMRDKAAASQERNETFRGIVAVDLAGEGVELGTPVHIRKKTNRSYVAALSAIPYHVDNVSEDGTAISKQPVNFTYSEASNGGNMTVSYGKSTTNSTTNTVKQDLSQSIETMFLADPKAKGGSKFEKVKGVVGYATAIGNFARGIQIDNMTTEQKKAMVWKPDASTPLDLVNGLIGFFTDRVDKINELTNQEASTTTIEKNITATTHDAILFTSTARHIWRYPVLTRPIPMWLAFGPRIDSTQIDDPSTVNGDKELFITFTMSENAALSTSNSIADSLYQPLHEEGNFFSYPPSVASVEGYNPYGLLADENTWEFSDTLDNAGITFTKATSNMQHTETKVTPSGFTLMVSFFERLFKGDNAKSIINMPNSDNPKTFSKEYSKTERISYSLQGSSELTANMAADHTVKMQPFVAKEGAMTFGTAVELNSTNNAKLWDSDSLYQQKPDPSLYLPLKFVKSKGTFIANTYDKAAMKIRGIKFYMQDFAFFSDNRLMNGQNYEVRVPLYNASFRDTGDFKVRLSWADNNTLSADKNLIAETTVSLGGWKNDKNNNKGWAAFEWTPNLTSSARARANKEDKPYYLYVEVDPENQLSEVHEERYSGGTLSDYGGNNTGFYPFYVYDMDDPVVSVAASNSGNFTAAADENSLTPLYFTDSGGNRINDMSAFILEHKDESFVPVTANFTYSGSEVPYAFFAGYVLTQSGKQKIPEAGINTMVDLSGLEADDIEEVFTLQDIALFNGNNQVTFIISPSELLNDTANDIAAKADLITFGIENVTEDEIILSNETFYEGEDPDFELEAIPDDIVSSATGRVYTLTSDKDVFWIISGVKLNRLVSASDESDGRDYLDITLETVSEDSEAPRDYGREAVITVSSIAGYTPKGDYEITVQKSADGDEWADAGVLRFSTEDGDSGSGGGVSSSSNGCNSGLGLAALAFLAIAFRRKN